MITDAATEESANKVMTLLRVDVTGRGVNEQSLQIPLPFLDGGGLKSRHLVSLLMTSHLPSSFDDTRTVRGS